MADRLGSIKSLKIPHPDKFSNISTVGVDFLLFSRSMENVTVYAQSNGVQTTAKLVIKDFPKVMLAGKPGKGYPSENFMVGDTPMVVLVYPNGVNEANKGQVSIYLKNQGDAAITVKFKFTTDVISRNTEATLEANLTWGYALFMSHVQCVDVYQDKDFVVTVNVEIPDVDLEILGKKPSDGPKRLSVWEKVYTNMERTDFTFVFNSQEVSCHKHILAAASPVLRAMVENQHVEAIKSKASIELSEEVGRAFVRFIYTGKLDENLLKEHAPAFLELGEMYDLIELKNAAERELVIQLDKKTMVKLLSIGELLRAEQLFEAALKMTKTNISWLRSQV